MILQILFNIIDFQERSKGANKNKIFGYMFGDYFYNLTRDTGFLSIANVANGGIKDLNGFQFRKIHFTYDYKISESFSTKFGLEADQSAKTSNGKIGVLVKDAYMKWKNIFKGSNLIFGISPTPAFEASEGIWENRFLEKTIMDLRDIVSSRDLTIAIKGKIDSGGIFQYWIKVGNGSRNKPKTDKYKRFYGHIQISPIEQFTATFYADLQLLPNINDSASITTPATPVTNNELTYALFLGYREKNAYAFGIEAFLTSKQNEILINGELKDKIGIGFSTFASYNINISEKLATVGGFDYYDPNTNAEARGDLRKWFILSLNYNPNNKVTISPNIIIETYESIPNGRAIDASITPRITFYYTFF